MALDVYDIAVIGAGPAGSVAAYAAARRGFSVALVDRCAFPRDKSCGDGIGPAAVRVLHGLGLAEVFDGHQPIDMVALVGPDGRRTDTRVPWIDGRPGSGYVIAREEFDHRLFRAAVAAGAADHTGRRFLGTAVRAGGASRAVRLGDARGDGRHTLGARLLVGADGAYSAVRRSLARPPARPARSTGFALRAYARAGEDRSGPAGAEPRILLEFRPELLPSYGWVFPLGGGRINLGVGGPLDVLQRRGADLRKLLEDYADSLRRRGLAAGDLHGRRGHHLPHVAGMPRLTHPRAALVGDAASMINPVSGEGIAYAVTSAAQLVDALPPDLRDGAALSASLARFEAAFRRRHRLHFLCNRTTLRLMSNPLYSTAFLRAVQRDAHVLDDAIDMLFGFGRFHPSTALRVLRAQV